MRTAQIALSAIIAMIFCASGSAQCAEPVHADKKLIEYGWDVPYPDYIRANIKKMEKRPFDGLILRLRRSGSKDWQDGGRIFTPQRWTEDEFKQTFDDMAAIEWNKFTENFVCMYAASDMDWFNDEHWEAVRNNVRLVVMAACLGRCRGICFDPEPYGNNPWTYGETIHREKQSFAQYQAKVRQRGAEFMQAIMSEMPEAVIHTFYNFALFDHISDMADPRVRELALSRHPYSLYPAFLNGMLDAAGPGIRITDGNENAYYYTNRLPFFTAYHSIRQRSLTLVEPENRDKYKLQLQVSQALYVDHLFGLRQPNKYPSNYMTPEERAKWFEHNVYYALLTSDRYVWLYSERMNWWTNENVPPGLEDAVISARKKVAYCAPMAIDPLPSIQAAERRMAEETSGKLVRRTADIARLPDGIAPPVVDGKLDDPAWGKASALEKFLPPASAPSDATPAQTKGHVAYDDQALYIALSCAESEPGKMSIVGNARDDSVWMGDSVDVFLHPAEAPILHFILNPRNVQWDASFNGQQENLSFNPDWKSAVSVEKDCWNVEIVIPWASILVNQQKPRPGQHIRANICRNRCHASELSTWSSVVQFFTESDSLGKWVFK
ncbi:MAG TPA: sugar-binding protein [Candidatus Brocadiia bacterium]|nr:sugar-binding protein [Candidatus Brocadiia bacterium]